MTTKRKLKTTKLALLCLLSSPFFVKFEFHKQKVFSKAEFKPKIYKFFEFLSHLCVKTSLQKLPKNINLNFLAKFINLKKI